MKDTLFQKKTRKPFQFNQQVTDVFDDMLLRSIPSYKENLEIMIKKTVLGYQKNTVVYDLGCSHGNLSLALAQKIKCKINAVDSSKPMLEKFEKKIKELGVESLITLHHKNIEEIAINNTSVVIMNYILQFTPLVNRDLIIKNIFNGLVKNGILLLAEKITHSNLETAALYRKNYHQFKLENNYTQLEIDQKEKALKGVLISETMEQHINRLEKTGFNKIDIWFHWNNFMCLTAKK